MSAVLRRPTGLAVAADGTVWIVDSSSSSLRAVAPDGTISTATTQLYIPYGASIGPTGTVFVAETGVYRIVTVAQGGGLKAVVGNQLKPGFAGDGGLARRALLFQPYDLAVDDEGNLYIADTGNERVRFVDVATSKIRTLAGNGTQGFAGDGAAAGKARLARPQGIAVDRAGTVLYVGDSATGRLRRVDLDTGIITTVAGTGGAPAAYDPALTGPQTALSRLQALALDAEGNLYFSVFYGNLGQVVMRMTPDGALTRIAGGGRSLSAGVPPLEFSISDVLALEIEPTSGALLMATATGVVYRIDGVATPAG